MFVKVIIGEESKGQKVEALYECDKASIHPQDEDTIWLSLTRGTSLEQLELTKKTTAIYMMNNDGKTISNYRWH